MLLFPRRRFGGSGNAAGLSRLVVSDYVSNSNMIRTIYMYLPEQQRTHHNTDIPSFRCSLTSVLRDAHSAFHIVNFPSLPTPLLLHPPPRRSSPLLDFPSVLYAIFSDDTLQNAARRVRCHRPHKIPLAVAAPDNSFNL